MPDFVSENSLNASELETQLAKAKEANEKHILEEEPERKSLYEQLKESKEQKHLEYQKQLESQNSSYKLDEKSAKYYDELKKNEREKEQQRLRAEAEKVNLYRNLKKTQQKPISKSLSTTSTTSAGEISSKSSIILKKRKLETHSGAISETKKNKDSTKLAKGLPSSPNSPIVGANDKSTNTTESTSEVIRPDTTTTIELATTNCNTLQGLGDYSSSEEE